MEVRLFRLLNFDLWSGLDLALGFSLFMNLCTNSSCRLSVCLFPAVQGAGQWLNLVMVLVQLLVLFLVLVLEDSGKAQYLGRAGGS